MQRALIRLGGLVVLSWLIVSAAADAAPSRLAEIRGRGVLECGVWPYVPGFAVEKDGRYSGFDIDVCRAVAAAILGDAAKVRFVTLADVSQFTQRRDIDLVIRRLTWTLSREGAAGLAFGPVTFYDGQGFLVPRASGIRNAAQLAGERVCVIDAEHHPRTLYDYFDDRGQAIRLVLVESDREAEQALLENRCRAYSADISWLAAARSHFQDGVSCYEVLPDVISKEPLAPLMRARDSDLIEVVRWTIFSMIHAEELGLNSRNIGAGNRPRSSGVRAFLQAHPGGRVALGAGDWVRTIITGVGNYGEIYNRNLGAESPIRLARGVNRLWGEGGLVYAPPLGP